MAYREVSNQSWGGRIVSSFGSVLLGVLLFLVAFPVLFWNEGRAVHTEQSLAEGAKNVVSVEADKVETANDGKLVHITAKATTDDTPADHDFGAKAPKDIRLVRAAEMYQYKEEAHTEKKKNLGGSETTTTTYTYAPGWYTDLQDSSAFHDPDYKGKNPTKMAYTSQKFEAEKVTVGAFVLPLELADKIRDAKPFPVAGGPASKVNDAPEPPDRDFPPADKDHPKPSDKAAPKPADVDAAKPPPGFRVEDGEFYKGKEPKTPEIGDVRVSYQVVEPTTVSVIAKQSGSTFTPYQAQAGDQIELLKTGAQDAASMFQEEQDNNKTLTWILRVVGFLMMAFGLFLVMKPLSVLGDVVPFIGNMVGALLAVIAGGTALAFSLITISIAWLFYRPLIGVPLLIAGIASLVFVFWLARKKKAPTAEAV